MRYRLRTLLILLAVALAGLWLVMESRNSLAAVRFVTVAFLVPASAGLIMVGLVYPIIKMLCRR